MNPDEFIELIVAGKCQFTECDVLKEMDKFFCDAGNVRNGEKRKSWIICLLIRCYFFVVRMNESV